MPNKARRYLLSPLAESDLEEIWAYTYRTWSAEQAERYHETLIEAMEWLARGSKIGRDASDVRGGYRRYSAGRHVIFFRESEDAIAVIRILHQSMDLPAHLES